MMIPPRSERRLRSCLRYYRASPTSLRRAEGGIGGALKARLPSCGGKNVERCELRLAEAEDYSGAEPEIILAVVQAVRDFCHEVLGLYGANGDVLGQLEIEAAAGRHRKIIFGAG